MWRLLLLLLMGAASACGRPGCDGAGTVPGPGAPLVRNADLLGQQAGNPWSLICSLDFVASQGNLAGGSLLLYVSGRPTPDATEPLAAILQTSDLAPDATAGKLGFLVPLAPTVNDGQHLRLGVQLAATPPPGSASGSGKRSNCYELELAFAVSPVARTLRARHPAPTRLAALLPRGPA